MMQRKNNFLNLFTIIYFNFYFGILNVYANANVFVNKCLYISDVTLSGTLCVLLLLYTHPLFVLLISMTSHKDMQYVFFMANHLQD